MHVTWRTGYIRFCLGWLAVAACAAGSAGQDSGVVAAIEAYEPLWRPARDQLQNVTVVLHPSDCAPGTAEEEAAARLSLLTAEYLYHLIRMGGGGAVLTRVDKQSVPARGADTDEAVLMRVCRQTRAELVLILGHARSAFAAESQNSFSQSLAALLASTPGVRAAHAVSVTDTTLPAVRLDLSSAVDDVHASGRVWLHRRHAEAIYKALVIWADDHRTEMAAHQARQGDGDSQTEDGTPLFLETRKRDVDRVAVLARSIWPDGALPASRAGWFASMFQRLAPSDRTIVYFEPEVQVDGDAVIIKGATNVPVLVHTLQAAFHHVGIKEVRSEMRLLPDMDRLGDELYGVCQVPTALTRRQPHETSVPQSQLLFGEPVFLLDVEDDYLLVQAGDGYWGWVRRDSVARMDVRRFARCIQAPYAVFLHDFVLDRIMIPQGSRLPIAFEDVGKHRLITPHETVLEVPASVVEVAGQSDALDQRARRALDWVGIPYVFGGRSPLGLDCSGFLTNLCEQENVPIARDAAGQLLAGKLVATHWCRDTIRAGDRLYFINPSGKVFHTGIALSSTHFVHAVPPAVQINSLRSGDRLYDEELDHAFLAAKRP